MEPQAYCQQKAIQSGSSFYYSFLCLPKPQKEAMIALYAYCREVDDVVDEIKEPQVAEKKLTWWIQETHRFESGAPTHPVTKALFHHQLHYPWPKALFFDLLRGMKTDLEGPHFKTFSELEDYCYCVAGTIGLLSTYVFGFEKPQTLEYAKHLGTALQTINIIRDLGEDLRRQRIYIPDEDLAHFGIDRERLLNFEYQDQDLIPLLQFQARRARQFYQVAMNLLPKEDRPTQKAAMVMAHIYLALLKTIEEENFKVLHQKIKLTPLKKLWIAWKTLRQEKKLCQGK